MIDCDLHAGVTEQPLKRAIRAAGEIPPGYAFAYPWPFDVLDLKSFVGRPFSREKFRGFATGHKCRGEDRGLTCAELLALCDRNRICQLSCRHPEAVRAVDFQAALLKRGAVGIDLSEVFGKDG